MTLEELQKKIDEIKQIRDDDEVAHSREDRLRHDVLEAVAEGSPIAKELAELVLTTTGIHFSRWCA